MKKTSIETAVGIFVLVGIICVAYLTVKLGKMELMGDNYYSLYANFTSATGLKSGANVEMAGVRIGQIDEIGLEPIMNVARVKLKIEKGIDVVRNMPSLTQLWIDSDFQRNLLPAAEFWAKYDAGEFE